MDGLSIVKIAHHWVVNSYSLLWLICSLCCLDNWIKSFVIIRLISIHLITSSKMFELLECRVIDHSFWEGTVEELRVENGDTPRGFIVSIMFNRSRAILVCVHQVIVCFDVDERLIVIKKVLDLHVNKVECWNAIIWIDSMSISTTLHLLLERVPISKSIQVE